MVGPASAELKRRWGRGGGGGERVGEWGCETEGGQRSSMFAGASFKSKGQLDERSGLEMSPRL